MKNRTFGVEIECASKIDRNQLASKIEEAFTHAGIGHLCRSNYYHHNTDGTNVTRWEVQSDASIRTTNSHSNQVEVVSPVLSGPAGLEALKVVCGVVEQYGKINSSCGLHVHHGVDSWEDVKKISAAFSQFQDVIYMGLPPSRSRTIYCNKWNTRQTLNTQIRAAKANRYTGLNLCSYALRETIEFRCAAGSTDYEKISNWILFTQGLVESAIAGLNPTGMPANIDSLAQFVAPVTETTDDYDSIRGKKPAPRQIAQDLNDLVGMGCFTRAELQTLMMDKGYNVNTINTHLAGCLNVKYNVLKTRVVVNENGFYQFAETNAQVTADADYQQAATWFKTRHDHFQNAA